MAIDWLPSLTLRTRSTFTELVAETREVQRSVTQPLNERKGTVVGIL